jgi:predicted DNA-binding ribbon-helix-helix protein
MHGAMDKLSDITNTRLRILQHKGERTAIRLENIFWSQLTEFASEDATSLSKLVFGIIEKASEAKNRTSLLRCYCIDRWRKRASTARLENINFDMLAIIAACPTPVVIITPERKIAAFNPSFSTQIIGSKTRTGGGDSQHRGIKLTFSEPLTKIQQRLIDDPTRISTYQVGFYAGNTTTYHRARFAIADRAQKHKSMLILFIDVSPKERPVTPDAAAAPAASALP